MIRGRRGIAVVVTLLCALFFTGQVAAWEMGMTATVPMSPLWRELIADNSIVTLDTRSHRNIAALHVELRGTQVVTFPKQTLHTLLFHDAELIDSQILETGEKGIADFTFVYKLGESYRILLIDRTDDTPFVIRTILF